MIDIGTLAMASSMPRSGDVTYGRVQDLMLVSGRLAAALDPSEVIAAVLDAVIRLFNLQACTVGLLEPDQLVEVPENG